jgi:iron complex outermembrane receptor protein
MNIKEKIGDYSCIISNGDRVYKGVKRGVADLFGLLQEDASLLDGADVIDKVIGKGAAALLITGKVSRVFTPLISEGALRMLKSAGIAVAYDEKVPVILNRNKNGMCPLESRCLDTDDAGELLPVIAAFRTEMQQKMNNNK